MADDTVQDILTEAALLERGKALLDTLQAALDKFTDTTVALATHENDEAAHPFIQNQIQAVVDGTGFLTEDEATSICTARVNAHDTNTKSHTDIRTLIANISTALTALTARVDEISPVNNGDPLSALETALAAVDAIYDPIIESEKAAFVAAQISSPENVDAIAAVINSLTLEKAAARYQVFLSFNYTT